MKKGLDPWVREHWTSLARPRQKVGESGFFFIRRFISLALYSHLLWFCLWPPCSLSAPKIKTK